MKKGYRHPTKTGNFRDSEVCSLVSFHLVYIYKVVEEDNARTNLLLTEIVYKHCNKTRHYPFW